VGAFVVSGILLFDSDVLDTALLLGAVHEVDCDALLFVTIVLDVVKGATKLDDSAPVTEVLGKVCSCNSSCSFSCPPSPPANAMLVKGLVVLVEYETCVETADTTVEPASALAELVSLLVRLAR
jgi:hypothetical protein